jgi:hypothetical protein
MANQNSSGFIVLSSILGMAVVGTVVYLFMKNSSSPANTASALANVQTAKNNLANLKSNPNASAAQLSAANTALQDAQAALKKLQSSSSSKGGASGSGSSAGGGSSKSGGTKPAADQLVPVSPDGSYMEKSDPTTLYNNDGSVKGNLDSNSGMFVDASGKLVAAGDGSSVINSDPKTGAYQESDGSWYLADGTALNSYDPATQNYQEVDGTNYLGSGVAVDNTIAPVDNTTASVDTSTYGDISANTTVDTAPVDYGASNYGNFVGAGSKHFAGFVGAGTLFK